MTALRLLHRSDDPHQGHARAQGFDTPDAQFTTAESLSAKRIYDGRERGRQDIVRGCRKRSLRAHEQRRLVKVGQDGGHLERTEGRVIVQQGSDDGSLIVMALPASIVFCRPNEMRFSRGRSIVTPAAGCKRYAC